LEVQAAIKDKAAESTETSMSLDCYLAADDGVCTYHLQRWQSSSDQVLADLCRRFLDRDLFKALDVTDLDPPQQQKLLCGVYQLLQQAGFMPQYYAGLRVALSRGYTLYQRGIKLQTERGLQEISELSPLVQTLIKPVQRPWLIYPREIESGLLALHRSLSV
jgi:hypothetical protein